MPLGMAVLEYSTLQAATSELFAPLVVWIIDQPLGMIGAVAEPELTAMAISSWNGAEEDGVQLFDPLHAPP
jgi:hypothetical protein